MTTQETAEQLKEIVKEKYRQIADQSKNCLLYTSPSPRD